MRIYTVHRRPGGRGRRRSEDADVVLVKEGFSWPALFVPLVWALYHRLWLGAAAYVGAALLLAAGAEVVALDAAGQSALGIAFTLLVAWSANDWRRWTLARAGYRLAGVVSGPTLVAAERRLFAAGPPDEPVATRVSS